MSGWEKKKKGERERKRGGGRGGRKSLCSWAEMGEDDSEVGATFSRKPERRGGGEGCRIWGGMSVENKVD